MHNHTFFRKKYSNKFLTIWSTSEKKLESEENKYSLENIYLNNYLKLTDACHTKANNKNKTGITGKTSTIGSNMA